MGLVDQVRGSTQYHDRLPELPGAEEFTAGILLLGFVQQRLIQCQVVPGIVECQIEDVHRIGTGERNQPAMNLCNTRVPVLRVDDQPRVFTLY